MTNLTESITQLFSIRNKYGKPFTSKKLNLLKALAKESVNQTGKKAIEAFHNTLLFLLAYPDNKAINTIATQCLEKLHAAIRTGERLQINLYNTGIAGSSICAAFSFELVKWLRKKDPKAIKIDSFDADEGHIQYIISAVMPKVESEILQDANAEWRGWLAKQTNNGEELLDQLIAIFDTTDIRPEVKDELWNAMGLNVEINLTRHCALPENLIQRHYHRTLNRHNVQKEEVKPVRVKVSDTDAEAIIDAGRMILVRHLREIDPVSFTSIQLVDYYHLSRGVSVALMGMVKDRRHPIDSYMGYVAFKNGLPVAYAGSWILFDSARIGLNVFPSFRGGESQNIFNQVLQLHKKVYNLKRFTVDPYQLGKDNSDGIKSGAFWVYYHAGFRPLLQSHLKIAAVEAEKINANPRYRTPAPILKKLADGRMGYVLNKSAVQFDAIDISLAWAAILKKKFKNNRQLIPVDSYKKLASGLGIKNYQEANMKFVLQNWSMLLLAYEKELRINNALQSVLKILFNLKANGKEEEYISVLQKSILLRKFLEGFLIH